MTDAPPPASTRVLRYEVPVDDQAHRLTTGPIVHVATRRADVVEVWAMDPAASRNVWTSEYRVVGTGHWIEDGWEPVGSAVVPQVERPGMLLPAGTLVWHLFRRSVGGTTDGGL